jgi:hypothetical protein
VLVHDNAGMHDLTANVMIPELRKVLTRLHYPTFPQDFPAANVEVAWNSRPDEYCIDAPLLSFVHQVNNRSAD